MLKTQISDNRFEIAITAYNDTKSNNFS